MTVWFSIAYARRTPPTTQEGRMISRCPCPPSINTPWHKHEHGDEHEHEHEHEHNKEHENDRNKKMTIWTWSWTGEQSWTWACMSMFLVWKWNIPLQLCTVPPQWATIQLSWLWSWTRGSSEKKRRPIPTWEMLVGPRTFANKMLHQIKIIPMSLLLQLWQTAQCCQQFLVRCSTSRSTWWCQHVTPESPTSWHSATWAAGGCLNFCRKCLGSPELQNEIDKQFVKSKCYFLEAPAVWGDLWWKCPEPGSQGQLVCRIRWIRQTTASSCGPRYRTDRKMKSSASWDTMLHPSAQPLAARSDERQFERSDLQGSYASVL